MRWMLLIPLFLLSACGEKDTAQTEETDTDTDTDTDSDTDADSDADSDTDADIELSASASSITSRETVIFTVSLDGTDITGDASFTSSDEALLAFYEDAVGQPLDEGTVTVTATYGGNSDSVNVDITLVEPESGELVINEVLADATVDGDPNQDGSTDSVEDEFVEIVNVSGISLDLTGIIITENDFGVYLPRHTFNSITLKAGEAVVVFGGGDVSNLSETNAYFFVADNEDPGESYGLGLNDVGERVTLYKADGSTKIATMAYGTASAGVTPSAEDASLVLSPELSGTNYVSHDSTSSSMFSPGTKADGSSFPGVDGSY